jgi:uncharacterized protein
LSTVERVYINTGPMVAFLRADHLYVLRKMPIEFVITTQVEHELLLGNAHGLPQAILDGFTREFVEEIDDNLLEVVHAGEASVIQAALRHGNAVASIDEKEGRALARRLGLRLRGTLGILLDAKKLGLIDAVGPVVERMLDRGLWFSQKLIAQTLARAGELPDKQSLQ